MKKERTNRRNVSSTILFALLMVALLSTTACAKKEDAMEEAKVSNEEVVETKVEEKEEGITPETTAEPESTTEAESMPETEVSSEPIVYEGIDYESTLPGREWIETLVGIIDEPKIIVFRDGTNKKIIVEEGQIVSFQEGDTIAVYLPDGVIFRYSGGGLSNQSLHSLEYEHSVVCAAIDMDFLAKENKRLKELGGAKFDVTLENNGKEQQLNCIISLVE